MQTSSERRLQNAVRIAYGQPIALSHEGYHEPFDAECVDLSPGGLSLRASCLPGVGETLTCHFAAPDADQQIEVRGEVVWAHLEGHRGGEFGVRFLDVDAITVALISEMIGEQESRTRRDSAAAQTNQTATAQLAVDGSTDTFTARLLRRSSGLVTFEQDLSFLKLGRGVSAYQGDDVQRGQIASVAVRYDGATPKLMVTLRYEPSEAPDDAHTRSETDSATDVDALNAKTSTERVSHDTTPDLDAPVEGSIGRGAVTLTEFDAAFSAHAEPNDADGLPTMSTRSEFDLPSAVEEADAPVTTGTPTTFDDEDVGPALFTADEDSSADQRYEEAAARMLGDRQATVHVAETTSLPTVERCDPSVMFSVDDTDDDFRPKRAPAALTIAASFCLSLIGALRRIALSAWQRAQSSWLPVVKARTQGLAHNIGPKATALWARTHQQSLPWMRSTLRRAIDARDHLSQRLSGQGRRRRTTGFSVAPVSVAPSVNRRSLATEPTAKRPLQFILLAVAAVTGLGLASYALFSAPDPRIVPVHREITPAPGTSITAPAASIPAAAAPTIQAPAITLPAVATALPAPSYEAGRIAAPSYPSIERAAPIAVKATEIGAAATEPAVAVPTPATIESTTITSNAGQNTKQFGASSVRGRHFILQMSAPVKALSGSSDDGGFSVIIDGALSLDRAGPIAANHSGVARAMILNKGDRAELTIRFRDGLSPKYQVLAKADTIEITIEE
jgi:hypothetical protein